MPFLITKCQEMGQKIDSSITNCTKKPISIIEKQDKHEKKQTYTSSKNVNSTTMGSPAVKSIRVQLKKDYNELLEMLEEVSSYNSTKSKPISMQNSSADNIDSCAFAKSITCNYKDPKGNINSSSVSSDSFHCFNNHCHALSEVAKNCNLLMSRDRTCGRFFIKRKRSEIKEGRYIELANLQIKKIELKPKSFNRKDIGPANNNFVTSKNNQLRKRSFSPIQENAECIEINSTINHRFVTEEGGIYTQGNVAKNYKKQPNSRTHNFEKYNTNEECIEDSIPPAWISQKQKQTLSNIIHSSDRRTISQCKKTRPGKEQSKLNKSVIEKPQKPKNKINKRTAKSRDPLNKKIADSDIIQLPPKKPPVPRFKFLLRPEKDKEEWNEREIEKPKPKPHPPAVFQCNDYYFVMC